MTSGIIQLIDTSSIPSFHSPTSVKSLLLVPLYLTSLAVNVTSKLRRVVAASLRLIIGFSIHIVSSAMHVKWSLERLRTLKILPLENQCVNRVVTNFSGDKDR